MIIMEEKNSNENIRTTESFSYTYSAKQQEELQAIHKRYLPPEEDKMEQLRRLDKSVTSKGTAAALIVGILSTLVLGFGMSCCMVWADKYFVLGVITGIAGLIGAGLAYPVYSRITKKERERLAPEILKLTEELMK